MGKVIKEIMTKDVVWVNPKQTLLDALNLIRKFNIRHLPVVDKNTKELVGLLSEGDIILYCQKKGEKLEVDTNITVSEAMSRNVIYCYPSSSMANVAATMISAKIDSIPVLEGKEKKLVGIVTTTDLLDELCLAEELNGENVWPLKYDNPNHRNFSSHG